ncbi:restriction endonuclease subunit S [Pantoea sp. USHLN298]|uniref:restriction endonuclease subunit S n=1 Tax=Pantoea sp. USHLN298 TaxID=3081294 RepID=UPI003016226D
MPKFNHYESYRASEYFKTEMPSHWEEKQLGYLAKQDRNAFVDGPFGSDLKTTDYQDGGIPLIQLNNIRDGKHFLKNTKFVTEKKRMELSRHIAYPKDIVFAKMAEPVARAAKVNEEYPEYVIVADCVKMTPNKEIINEDYLVWAANSDCVRINAELVSTGTTRIRINLGELKKIRIPFPPMVEQLKVALFLDHETAKIDNLIEKQQQLIELLKEKRQAVISHAVTKGLRPDVPMKDSGVEWLGEVPEHWKLIKFSHCVSIRSGQVDPRKLPYCDYWLIAPNHIVSGEGRIINLETAKDQGADSGKYLCRTGEVIYSKIRPALVKACLSPSDTVLCSADMYPMSSYNGLTNNFLLLYLLSDAFTRFAVNQADRVAMPKINRESLSDCIIPVPPIEEQGKIYSYAREALEKLDVLLQKSQLTIELLQERRSALISATVTGKIDVRDWVAPEKQQIEEPQETTA